MTEYPAESQDSLDGQGSAGGHEAEGPRGASGTREVSSPTAASPSAVAAAAALDDDFDFSDFEEPPPADARGTGASASEPSDESPETKRGEAVWPPSSNAGGDVAPTDRPTVVPPFDIESYARSSLTSAPPVAPAAPTFSSLDPLLVDESPTTIPPRVPEAPGSQGRPTMPTLTDEGEIERARLSMFDTSPPPEKRAATTAPPRLPSGVLSLADARLPTPGAMPAVSAPVSLDHEDDAPELEVRDSTIPQALQDPVVEMKDRFNLGDFTGAMSLAESILLREPANAEALRLAEECQRVLIKMYAAKIGPLDRVPTLNVQPQELRWLSIDHRAGFLLSLVDGTSTIEMILDLSGMPLLDTLRILNELHQQRIISFRS